MPPSARPRRGRARRRGRDGADHALADGQLRSAWRPRAPSCSRRSRRLIARGLAAGRRAARSRSPAATTTRSSRPTWPRSPSAPKKKLEQVIAPTSPRPSRSMCWASCRGWPTSRASSRRSTCRAAAAPRARAALVGRHRHGHDDDLSVRESRRLAPDRPHAALDVRPAPRAAGVPGAGRFAHLPAHRPREPSTASRARSRPARFDWAKLVKAHERRAEGRPRGPVRHPAGSRPHRLTWRSACRPRAPWTASALTLANALGGNPAEHGGRWRSAYGSRPAGRGRQRARGAGRAAVAGADRERPDAPPKPLESDRTHLLKRGQVLRVGMIEGVEHRLSRRRRRLRAAALHGQPLDLCPRRRRRLRGPQARRRRRAAARARAGAGRRRAEARRSPSTTAAGRSASSGGRRTTISARRAAAPSSSPTIASPRKPTAWASASRDRPSSIRRAPTSSPTASARRHPGAGRRPADRAAGRPADRRRLLQDRHRGLGRPAAARPPAAGPDRPLRAGHRRGSREAAPRPGGAPRARHRRFQGGPPAGRHRPRAALRGEPDRRRRLSNSDFASSKSRRLMRPMA